ncbi:hypothetical protein DUNSADRAFT_11275 [Dunaliella salina]|uniref:Chromatin assembly factor 1 subunit A dimerization domain-containing protein n=1 Tax=Dunaliella salina TaxID=3046 RepID=A0ABQ7GDP1_DUNSA|nr:hypothetical protein DUNSADRAFT_11275 [Dunaliella salina]|eukprot:KAF5832725.1 hypothetical protein DUNSADRAFT_11275 [Dunaliella salina]
MLALSQRLRSPVVSGRRPFGRDPGLDYEVMSDEEWEEEPEGESLSDDNDGEEMSMDGGNGGQGGNEDGEEAEGFVVEDGFLSEDEGAREMDEDATEGVCDAGPSATHRAPPSDPLLAALESGIARALRSNKPLIVSRLPLLSNSGMQAAQPALQQQQQQQQQGVQQENVPHQQQQQQQQRARGSDTTAAAGVASSAAGLGGAPSAAVPSGQDPEVLLGALCGSVLRPGTFITPPLERSIYAPSAGGGVAAAAAGATAAAGAGTKNGLQSSTSATASAVADPALLQDVLGHMEAAGLESAAGTMVQQAITAAAATSGGGSGSKGKGAITGLASHPQGLNCSGVGTGSGAGGAGSGVGEFSAGCTANAGGGNGGASRGGGRPPASFPEAVVPALAAFLQSTSERSVGKVVDNFHAAYSSGSLALLWGCVGAAPPKRTIKDKIKEIASYQSGTKSWAIAAGVPTTPTPLAQPQLPPALLEHAHFQQQTHLQQQQQQQQQQRQQQQKQAHLHQGALPFSHKPPVLHQSVLPATSPAVPAPAPATLPAASSAAPPGEAATTPGMLLATSQAAPAPASALGASLPTQQHTPDAPQAAASQAPLPQQQQQHTLHAQHLAAPSAPLLHEQPPLDSQAQPANASVLEGASAPTRQQTPDAPQAEAPPAQGSQVPPVSALAAPTVLGQSAEAPQAPESEIPPPPLPLTSTPTTAAAAAAAAAAAVAAAGDAEAHIELPDCWEPAAKCRRVGEVEESHGAVEMEQGGV